MARTMHQLTDSGRISRLVNWIWLLTLPAAGVALFLGQPRVAAGLAAGGALVALNLMGTRRAVSGILEGDGLRRLLAVLLWSAKFGATAIVVFVLLYRQAAHPLALLLGLGALPVSLLFDIFLFPVNKGEAKKP